MPSISVISNAGVPSAGVSAQQTITLTGAGPTYRLIPRANATNNLTPSSTAAAIQAELETLPEIGVGNVLVSGSVGGPFTVDFRAHLAKLAIPAMQVLGQGVSVAATVGGTTATGRGAEPGVVLIDTTNGGVYENQGTRYAPVWSLMQPTSDLVSAGFLTSATAASTYETVADAAALLRVAEITFTQTTGNGTYTGSVVLPAGSRIIDIGVDGQVLWNASTSASIVVGDGGSANGFFTATDLVATDLLAGEINNLEHPGGKAGSYILAEQRNLYSASARTISAVVTQVGTGAAGRTRVYVAYVIPAPVAATKV